MNVWKSARVATLVVAALFFGFFTPSSILARREVAEGLDAARADLFRDPSVALFKAHQFDDAIARSRNGSDAELRIRAKWLEAAALLGLHRAPQALSVARETLASSILRAKPVQTVVGDLHLVVGGALLEMGDTEAALREFQAASDIFSQLREVRSQAIALQNIGSIYLVARDLTHGASFFEKSATISGNDPTLRLTAEFNIGASLLDQGRPREALPHLNDAMMLAGKLNSPVMRARLLALLATAQVQVGNLAAAERSIRAGFAISGHGDTGEWIIGLYRAAAQLALRRGRLDEARDYVRKAFAASGGASTLLQRDVYRAAYEIYKARGETERSLANLEQYKRLDDQARATAASAGAALVAARFDFANQRASIAQLRANDVQNEARIARGQRTILVILLLASGLVSALLLFAYVSLRRNRDRIRAINRELTDTNSDLEDALAARTQFLATTSHEIRTPLNGILGMTQVLLADRSIEPATRSRIELVHGAGETMRALVDDILDIAKMTTGELVLHPEEMDLRRLLRDTMRVWEAQAEAKQVALRLDLAEAPAIIVADEVRLRQIIFNLAANAVKFTDRGEVAIIAFAAPRPDGEGECLHIHLRDTGIGIPRDKLEAIFESFRQVDSGTTRRHGGTGLGLAICRQLATAMGGTLTVDSVLGAGSTFHLGIPLVRGAEQSPKPQSETATLASARVLLVEGNPLTQSILRAVLTPKVATLAIVADGEAAEAAIAAGDLDLVVMDGASLGRDLDRALALAAAIAETGGCSVLLWPSADPPAAASAAGRITRLLPLPIAAPELVAALESLYTPHLEPEEMAA